VCLVITGSIIYRYSADQVFGKDVDPIGQTIYAHIGYVSDAFMGYGGYNGHPWMADMPDGIPVKVVGVSNEKILQDPKTNTNTSDQFGHVVIDYKSGYYSIVSSDLMRQIVSSWSKYNELKTIDSIYYPLFNGVEVEASKKDLDDRRNIGLSDMKDGVLPLDDEYQVAISKSIMDSVCKKLGVSDYKDITLSSLLGSNFSYGADRSMLFANNISNVTISGVFEQSDSIEDNEKTDIVFSKKIRDELYSIPVANNLSVYLKDPTKVAEFEKELNDKNIFPHVTGYKVLSNYDNITKVLIAESTRLSTIFNIISVILIVVLAVIYYFAIRLNSNSRRFDINILKSKGLTRWRIFGIMIAELVLLLIVAWVLSILPNIWVLKWLLSKKYVYKGIIFIPKFWHGLLAFLSLLIVGAGCVLFFDRNSYKSHDSEHVSDTKNLETQ